MNDKVVLVGSSNYDFVPGWPLGLMSIGTILTGKFGLEVEILDIPFKANDSDGLDRLAAKVGRIKPLFTGFSTMCNTLPRSLLTALKIKDILPETPIVFGGPQATANVRELFRTYQFIDIIVAGEAESVLGTLVESVATGAVHPAAGLYFREMFHPSDDQSSSHDQDLENIELARVMNMNELPQINYDLYPQAALDKGVHLDVGRGCPFECTFCSSSTFYKRTHRLKLSGNIIKDMRTVQEQRGTNYFSFVHDMFTADRKRLKRFCDELIESGADFHWACSARVDSVDGELLELMRRAGCKALFFGIESGSAKIQRIIKKRLNLTSAVQKVRQAAAMGFEMTVSLIIGFPEEAEDDLIETVNLALELTASRLKPKEVQVHLLCPLAGAPLTTARLSSLAYDGFITDMTYVDFLTPWEKEQVTRHRTLFSSFYYFSDTIIDRAVYKYLYWMFSYRPQFSSFMWLLYHFIGRDTGRMLVRWAGLSADGMLNGLDHRRKDLSLPALAESYNKMVNRFVKDRYQADRLLDAIKFDLWKNHQRPRGSGRIFQSPYDYQELTGLSEDELLRPSENEYTYTFDIATNRLAKTIMPEELREVMRDIR